MKAEIKAAKEISKMSNKQLFEVWELTGIMNSKDIPTVRGWLMDEIEKRFPVAFGKWLDGDAEDSTLKAYCLG